MKFQNNTLYIILFFLMFFIHFAVWQYLKIGFDTVFIKYYLFLTVLFMTVITVLSIIRKIYPTYLGFVFLGLVMFKLILMFLVMKKLNLKEVPDYKLHFIIPYLVSLILETLYSIKLIMNTDFSVPENEQEKEG